MRWFSLVLLVCLPLVAFAQPSWEHRIIDDNIVGNAVAAGDLNQDGYPDIVAGSTPIRAYINQAAGQFWEEYTVGGDSWLDLKLVDMNNDGDLDVVTCSLENVIQCWYEHTDNLSQWILRPISPVLVAWVSCDAYDIDNDGDMDVIARKINGNYWYENINGTGTDFIEHLILSDTNISDDSVLIVDIDADGDGDLICLKSEGVLYWVENNGNGLSWTQHIVGAVSGGAGVLSAADLNRDGNIDIITCYDDGDGLAWWNNSSGTGLNMTHHPVDPGTTRRQTSVADIDNDHDIDIIGVGGNNITYYQNADGVGGAWNSYTIATFGYDDRVWGSCTLDIDNDSDYDVIAVQRGANVHLWEYLSGGADELRVAFPNGGEVLRTNTTRNIVWNSTIDDDVRIELYLNNDLERVIVESTENDGIYEWTIPDDLILDDQYLIHIQVIGMPYQDFSDAPFAITSTPNLVITPFQPSLVVPPAGGGYWYWVRVYNPTEYPVSGQLWADVELPNGNVIGPVMSTRIQLGPQSVYQPNLPFSQFVPGYAPAGVYQHIMHIGMHPDLIIDSDSFQFAKQPGNTVAAIDPDALTPTDWYPRSGLVPPVNPEASDAGVENVDANKLEMSVTPNPCNARASVAITLPDQADLEVVVFNTLGQEVARIADGGYSAGTHTLTFYASELASGIYFVQVQTGTETALRKMVVVK